MRSCAIIAIVSLLAASCKVSTHTNNKSSTISSDSARVQLMRNESVVYGDFVTLRRFHQQLLQEVDSIQAPYTVLDSLFEILHVTADSVIVQRLHFDSSSAPNITVLLEQSQYHHVNYAYHRAQYKQIQNENGIERYTFHNYADQMEGDIQLWLDSLEEAGRSLARCKTDLKNRGFQEKSKELLSAYQPISQLELSMKNLSSAILQLQNLQSRFSHANAEEYFFTGPHLRLRRDLVVKQGIVSELVLHMNDVRQRQQEYYNQYKK